RRVAGMALAHRGRRDPFDPAGPGQEDLGTALDRHLGDSPEGDGQEPAEGPQADPSIHEGSERDPAAGGRDASGKRDSDPAAGGHDRREERDPDPTQGALAVGPPPLGSHRPPRPGGGPAAGRRTPAPGPQGRTIGNRAPEGALTAVAVAPSVRLAASRRAGRGEGPEGPLVEPSDLRQPIREQRAASLIVVVVDASGSMGAERRMTAARGAVLGLLRDA